VDRSDPRAWTIDDLAVAEGRSLATVLGMAEPAGDGADNDTDSAELYGFAELQRAGAAPGRGRPLLSVVPTTVWDESQAS
jgi:hypothetical protein